MLNDCEISPTNYMIAFLRQRGWQMPETTMRIPNVIPEVDPLAEKVRRRSPCTPVYFTPRRAPLCERRPAAGASVTAAGVPARACFGRRCSRCLFWLEILPVPVLAPWLEPVPQIGGPCSQPVRIWSWF